MLNIQASQNKITSVQISTTRISYKTDIGESGYFQFCTPKTCSLFINWLTEEADESGKASLEFALVARVFHAEKMMMGQNGVQLITEFSFNSHAM